jgi:PAS domain S-box-containing protein
VQDVTEQKQAEVEIQKVTTLLNNAQRIANLGGWELDLSTGKTLWTDEIYTIHEVDRDFDHNKINGIAFYHPDYQETIINAIKNTIQTQEPFDETCRFITAKGNYRWVRASGQAIIEDGKVTKLVGMFQDISKEKEAAQSLIRTQKMLTQTNKVARIGGWEFDIENSQIYWSDMMCHIHEIPIDTSLGIEMVFSFYEKESRDKLREVYKKAIQTEGSSYDLELKIITAKGNPVCVRAIGITEFKEGKCVKVYGTFQDITEQKQAQAEINTQKELLNTIITDLQEGLILINTEGAIIKVNKAFCQMTGYSEEELIGLTPPFPHWPEDSVSEVQEIFQNELTGNLNESFELTFQRKNGELFPAIIKPRSVKNTEGQILYMFKTVRDISEQRQYENNLLQAKKNAEAANKAKSEFLANMSHEIRTPLNGVIGFTDLLMKTELNAFQKEYMQTVFQSANSLLDIINDILDFSKIEAGKLELSITKVDILELMGQITDMVRPQIHKKGLEMLLDIPINCPRFIWVDGMRLRQILVNLLSNAIKFTKNGEIELRVKVLEEVNPQATKLSFSIRDTGIGIAPENQQKIFEAFSQEDASTTRRFGGTGLGLSISNNLLKLMDTHLRLKSQVGEGSTFYFEIELPSEKGESEQWDIETIKKILVVDDNENNLRIVKDMLSKSDIEVQLLQNGFDALGKLQKGERFDVIFMDYHMPIMDGIATVRSIRQVLNISAEEQSVIFLHSSMDDEELRKIFKELGVIQYLAKPLQINTLFRTLHKLKNPAMDALPQETVQEIDTNPIIATPTVLIVDDNHVNLLLAKSLVNFLLKDVNIIQANDGKEAIDMYLQHKPTLILMDIQMPEMNGYEASEAIRVLEKGKNVPIIALTAGTVKGERERCLEAGMNDYLSKPIVSEDLGVALKKWLLQTEILVKDTNIQSVENADIQIKHFDKEFLLERIHQDTDLLQVILEEGRKYLGNIWSVLYEQVKNEDWKSVHQTAHQLKGVSLSSCFPRLAELASEIEDLEEYEKNNIDRLIHSLEIEIEVVMGLIADELVR